MRQGFLTLLVIFAISGFQSACNLIANSDPKRWDGHADVLPDGIDTGEISDRIDGPDIGDGDVEPENLCGNGVPNVGEECDDGNEESGDGCENDCTFTCETATAVLDCNDGDDCTEESCSDHVCVHSRLPLTGVLYISAGVSHTCAVLNTGGVKCWGLNDHGQLGNGNTEDSALPVDVQGLEGSVLQVAAGAGHTCALQEDGLVKCWGLNNHGQLGDGSTTSSLTPVEVQGLSLLFVSISAGLDHTCVLKEAEGSVWCWGANGFGQLGIGSVDDQPAASMVSLGAQAVGLSAGHEHTCAVLEDLTARCWGNNAGGQLGINSFGGDQWSPVQVVGTSGAGQLNGITKIYGGGRHTCAIVEGTGAGSYCWGQNGSGQLGDGTIVPSPAPVAVESLAPGVQSLALGGFHTCAQFADGTAACWGDNVTGQLGQGDTTDTPRPTLVETGPATSMLAAGGDEGGGHTCAVTAGGEALCWGRNDSGQLGDGTEDQQLSPVSVLCN